MNALQQVTARQVSHAQCSLPCPRLLKIPLPQSKFCMFPFFTLKFITSFQCFRAVQSLFAMKEMKRSNHMHSAHLKYPRPLIVFKESCQLSLFNFFLSTLLYWEDMMWVHILWLIASFKKLSNRLDLINFFLCLMAIFVVLWNKGIENRN